MPIIAKDERSLQPVVECRGAGKSFALTPWTRRQVLEDVSFSVCAGEAVAIAGPSGAGKSTLLRLLLGLLPLTSGTVRLFGESPANALGRHTVGYLPDDQGLPPALTGDQVVDLHCGLIRGRIEPVRERLARMAMSDELRLPVRIYSHGMKVRLALAVALAGEPELLVLDEPFSGLDPQLRLIARQELIDYVRGGGAIVASSHLLMDLAGLASHVLLLRGGRLLRSASASEVFQGNAEEWFVAQMNAVAPS